MTWRDHRRDRQGAARAHRRRHDGLQEGAGRDQRRHGSRDRLAAHQGPRQAAKKSGRTAAEGLVGVAVQGTMGAAVEVNSETDFVAKNEQFQEFVRNVAQIALATGDDVEELGARPISGRRHRRRGADRQHRHDRREPVAAPRRPCRSSEGVVVSYVHNAAGAGPRQDRRAGRAGERRRQGRRSETLGKQLAMHVAAANPLALTGDELDADAGRARARHRDREGARNRQAGRDRREDGRGRDGQVPQGERAALAAVRDGQQDQVADVIAPRPRRPAPTIDAQGLCPLPARRRHREEGRRLRRRSRGGCPGVKPNRSPSRSR